MKHLFTKKFRTHFFAFTIALSMVGFIGCQQPTDESIESSTSTLKSAHITNSCMSVCLVAGQYMYVGTVNVGYLGEDLQVEFEITEPGIYLTETHVDVFTSLDDLSALKKISKGGAIPGKFTFKNSWSQSEMETHYTATIPADYLSSMTDGADCFYIAAHAALSNGETAWGGLCDESDKGVSLDIALQFPGKNWSTYFEFCNDYCEETLDFTYAWEDLNIDWNDGRGNDGDFNDLVIRSSVSKMYDQLDITLYAVARGAAYDHAFKIMVPKVGIVDGMSGGITGAANIIDSGDYYIITIFESTKAALPEEGIAPHQFAANTALADTTCTPIDTVEITIAIDDNFVFDPTKPYYPFITVHPGMLNEYDLNIYELAEAMTPGSGNTWIGQSGDEYPNGIIIPLDWKWPYERTNIKTAYTSFKSISEGFDPTWYTTTPATGTVFDIDCE